MTFTRKTRFISIGITAVVVAGIALFLSLKPADGIMQKKGNAYIVNTTKLTPDVRGYAGPVPIEVTISAGKITSIKALPNHETADFFQSAKNKITKQYVGLTVRQARALHPDAATGATYSSRALIQNINQALNYYEAHK